MTDETKDAPRPAQSLRRGASIGRYVVLSMVGRGAMGEVYAAYDPELDRKVAVKLLRAQPSNGDVTTTDAKSRLLREAQAIAKLSHPNVIGIHDVGSHDDRVFMAMEFIDGCTLGYWLVGAKRPWKEVLRVFTAAGHGLAAAHASGLVHRDFKAENVMLGRDDKVRVMDFGLARRIAGTWDGGADAPTLIGAAAEPSPSANDDDGEAQLSTTRVIPPPEEFVGAIRAAPVGARGPTQPSLATSPAAGLAASPPLGWSAASPAHRSASTEANASMTQSGAIVGTPAYMAPEQFSGGVADERSDQFSFCVALYEGLYGERPFPAKTPSELFAQVRRGEVRPAPDSTPVPGWLRRVVLRGLRVNPEERWPSMDALLAALHKDPRAIWRRAGVTAGAVAAIVAMAIAARQQGARESRPVCTVAKERFAGVWEPAGRDGFEEGSGDKSKGSRRASIAAAFLASGRPDAALILRKTTSALDRYVQMWSDTYTDNCVATNVRREQPLQVFELRMTCLADRWNEVVALSDVLADPTAEVVDHAAEAALALKSPADCGDVETLRAGVSRSVALWTTPGTMSLVAPRAHKATAAPSGERRSHPTDAAADPIAPRP